ncbi:MAG: hypothetical protein ACYCXW_15510 [Solirubrobacteraceae bacterium]
MTPAPDFVEPLIGWRAWHVIDTPDGLRLHSIGRPVVWEPGVEQRASCRRRSTWPRRRRDPEHPAPELGCLCGVWAVRNPRQAVAGLDIYGRSWKPVHRVLGRVSLWGKVVEYSDGWRAGFGYPAELFIPARRLHGPAVPRLDELIDALAIYRVPLSVLDVGARGSLTRALVARPI